MKKIPTVVILGPTASGKTALSIRIAKHMNGEIISADSMQIYKNMPIATAVPNFNERQGIPHHLVECLERSESFTVADFVKNANEIAVDIATRKKTPIIVGGTGLYVDSFLNNLVFSEQKGDIKIRQELIAHVDKNGIEPLWLELLKIDQKTAERLSMNDHKRVIRALELFYSSGATITQQNEESREMPSAFSPVIIGLTFNDRQKLYNRINERVDTMIENGLLEEARMAYLNRGAGAAAAIGHKELFLYFSGQATLPQAIEKLKMETRRYSKRQLTWFRRNKDINWIAADSCGDTTAEAVQIIENSRLF